MSRKLISFFTAVLIAGLVIPAFSAVENVKVGGDLTISGIYRSSFDFIDDNVSKDQQHFLYSGVRVYVSAELTNNVSAMVRLINERDWGQTTSVGSGDADLDVNLDLAYIQVKDIMTPGLSLTLGRQEIQIGEGLVVGSGNTIVPNTSTIAADLSLQNAFDAIRVDYVASGAPVSVFGFMAKINEDYGGVVAAGTTGDITLYGAELLWKGSNFTVEPYYVARITAYESPRIENDLMVGGVRGTWNVLTIPGLELKGEFAHEFGDASGYTGVVSSNYAGWAGYFGATYEFAHHIKPTITLGYNYYSGDDDAIDAEEWVPVYPTGVEERVGIIAYPALFAAGESTLTTASAAGTGLQAIKLGFGLTPIEKIQLGLTWYNLTLIEEAAGTDAGLGNEIDFTVDYAYTEDLSFGLAFGYFITGDNIKDTVGAGNEQNPWEAIVTATLTF